MTHKPTTELEAKVDALASFGINADKICEYIGVSKATLYKYYGHIMKTAKVNKVVQVANALFQNAVYENNVTAQIFFLKTQGQWKESMGDDNGEDGAIGAIKIEVIETKEKEDDKNEPE